MILNEALRGQQILAEKYGIASTVYSATSYQMLRRDAIECERNNRLHPASERKQPYVQPGARQDEGADRRDQRLHAGGAGAGRRRISMAGCVALGTDGFGRSETRKALRRFFEVDAEHVAIAALSALADRGELDRAVVEKAIQELGVKPDAPPPWTV